PVTAGMKGGMRQPISVADAVDVVGLNYTISLYDKYHAAHPDKPVTSSEDASSVMTRGEYVRDDARHVLDSYDDQPPEWANTHRVAWKAIATRPFMGGCFVWTGFDYRGEPTPFRWPTISSNFGIMDTCGFPKAAYYMRQAMWIRDRPVLWLIPHWNWPGTVEALDSRGRHVATANLPVQFGVSGGKIIGVGNGNPNSHESDKATARSLYNGYAQVIVQSQKGGAESLMVRAASPAVRAAT